MKTIKTLLLAVFALMTTQVVNAQCTGTVTVTGTSPSMTFTNSNPAGAFKYYNWDFGDGNYSSVGPTVSHTFANNGIYTVIGYYVDSTASSCYDSDTVLVTITGAAGGGNCSAAFTTAGNSPTFTFTPTNTPSSPINYYGFDWNFGDGNTGYTSNMNGISHTYTANGTYSVTCILYDSIFCSDTVTNTVTVTNVGGATCNAAFTWIDSGYTYTFNPTNPFAGAIYSWVLSDGSTYSTQNPTHTFSPTATGLFSICLTISDPITGCSNTYCDSIQINIGGGNCDATFTSNILNFTAAFTPSYPTSATGTYFWTFGDGNTSTLQNPFNIYPFFTGVMTYQVCLTIADSGCTDTYCSTITLVNMVNNISGYVFAANQPADSGVVFLIEFDSTLNTLTAIDTTTTDSNGYYNFPYAVGQFLVKAALAPTNSLYFNYLPTYYAMGTPQVPSGELLWSNADFISAPNNGSSYDILMIGGTNPGGPGFVGGLVSQGANKVGDPMSDIQIMITDDLGNPVLYDYSDNSGLFNISNLPYGDYIIYPEVYGKITHPLSFTLNAQNPNIDNFLVEVNSTTVDVSIATSTVNIELENQVVLYPNPAIDFLNVNLGNEMNEETLIEVLDLSGKVMHRVQVSQTNQTRINTTTLPSGMYLVRISTDKEEQTYRIVKQ